MLRKAFHSDTIYEALLPLFAFSKVFGLCGFSISRRTYTSSLYSIIFPTLLMVFLVVHSFSELHLRTDKNKFSIRFITDYIQSHVNILNAVLVYFMGIVYKNKTLILLKNISVFDEEMKKFYPNLPIRDTHTKTKFYSSISLIFVTLVMVLLFTTDTMSFPPKRLTFLDSNGIITYCTPFFVSSVMILQFDVCLLSLRERYKWINAELLKSKRRWNRFSVAAGDLAVSKKFEHEHTKKKLIDTLEDLRLRYDEVYTFCYELNTIYSVQLLFTICQIFVSTVVYLAYLIRGRGEPFIWCVYCLVVLCICTLQLLSVCYFCAWIGLEAKNSALILHEIRGIDDEIDIYVTNFSVQILHSTVNVNACHMFCINKSLVFSVTSGVTSYLMLILQTDLPK